MSDAKDTKAAETAGGQGGHDGHGGKEKPHKRKRGNENGNGPRGKGEETAAAAAAATGAAVSAESAESAASGASGAAASAASGVSGASVDGRRKKEVAEVAEVAGGKIGICVVVGCEFAGHAGGYCTEHAPYAVRNLALKSATERSLAALSRLKRFEQTVVMERYYARFDSFLITDADFATVLQRLKTGITPLDLQSLLMRHHWLLKHEQAHALLDECPKCPQNSQNAGDRLLGYEVAICSRVYDRWKLRTRGAEGYYAHPLHAPFYVDSNDVTTAFIPDREHIAYLAN